MFDIGMPELVLIFVVALLVFGPKKLPEIGKSIGRAIYMLKKSTNEFKQSIEEEAGTAQIKEDLLKQQRELQASLTQATAIDPKAFDAYKDNPADTPAAAEAPAGTENPKEQKKNA